MAFLGPWIGERGGANEWKIFRRWEINIKWHVLAFLLYSLEIVSTASQL